MKIYLDDERATPEGWHRTTTVDETLELLKTKTITELSLDNDLGDGQDEGYKVLDVLEQIVYFDKSFPIPIITVHSANASRVEYMHRAIDSIRRIRQIQSNENNT